MSCSASARPTPVNTLRPFQVVVMSDNPRMKMPGLGPSLLASPPPRFVICTPVTRCSASMTLLSGSLPMSSATMDSMTWTDSRLFSRPCVRLWRTPVTMTVSISSPLGGGLAGGGVCASAVAEMDRAAAADTLQKRLFPATSLPPVSERPGRGRSCPLCYYSDKC